MGKKFSGEILLGTATPGLSKWVGELSIVPFRILVQWWHLGDLWTGNINISRNICELSSFWPHVSASSWLLLHEKLSYPKKLSQMSNSFDRFSWLWSPLWSRSWNFFCLTSAPGSRCNVMPLICWKTNFSCEDEIFMLAQEELEHCCS